MPEAEESYFIRWRGKVDGPYPLQRIKELIEQERISRLHDLSIDQVTWQQADTFPALYPKHEQKVPQVTNAPEPNGDEHTEPQHTSIAQWYYSISGSVEGPCTTSDVKQMIDEGKLASSDYVSPIENPEDWRLVMEVSDFQDTQRPAIQHEQKSLTISEAQNASPNGRGFAITSMVLGLVGLCFTPLGILAIIFGGIARSRMKRSKNRAGSGMAITGLILGIIEVALLILLMMGGFGLTFLQDLPIRGL